MDSLFKVLGMLILLILFPMFVGVVMLYAGWKYGGWWGWGSGVVLVAPFFLYWYFQLSRRIKNYLALLEGQSKPFRWNVEKSVDEFVSLWKSQQRDEKE